MSALSRIAQRDHHFVHIEEGDTVLLASSLIPGNENAVYRVINGLARWGARVVHKGNALVHVSGHASAGELLYCYNIVTPAQRAAGARRDPAHARQRRAGPRDRRRERRDRRGRRGRRPGRRRRDDRRQGRPAATSSSTAASVGDITESDLKDRRILGEEGFISVIVVVDSVSGKVAAGPEIHARGFARGRLDFDEIKQPIIDALDAASPRATPTPTSCSRPCAGSSAAG